MIEAISIVAMCVALAGTLFFIYQIGKIKGTMLALVAHDDAYQAAKTKAIGDPDKVLALCDMSLGFLDRMKA